MGFSYGFRPGRSRHDALDAVTVGIEQRKISWVLDADIHGFFDTIDPDRMMQFIEHRTADRRMHRHIKRRAWLRARYAQPRHRQVGENRYRVAGEAELAPRATAKLSGDLGIWGSSIAWSHL
ncbi:MAG: hypothetical protein GWP08_08290 [Nitrospiraceae bacterium]|nr:hypothetical protein [Nitrospiraceae bacterium]